MNKNLLILMLMGSSLMSSGAHAQKVGNGGGEDVEFHKITSEVETWMVNNNNLGQLSTKLQLGSINSNDFLTNFSNAVNSTTLTFQDAPVIVAGQIRICGNDINPNRIVCNREMWNHQTAGNLKYAIVLHEYLGVAGYEKNILNYSQYPISKNILDFVYEKNVFELGLEKRPNSSINNPSNKPNYLEKLNIMYLSGSKPEIDKLLDLAWTGRCFFNNEPSIPYGAALLMRQKTLKDAGPIQIKTVEYQAAIFGIKNENEKHYDDLSVKDLLFAEDPFFLDVYFDKDSIAVRGEHLDKDRNLDPGYNLKVNGKYLILKFNKAANRFNGMCYYFNPEYKN